MNMINSHLRYETTDCTDNMIVDSKILVNKPLKVTNRQYRYDHRQRNKSPDDEIQTRDIESKTTQ